MVDYGVRQINFQCGTGTIYEYDIIQANASPNTGGNWTITVAGQTTSAINHNANAATILAALEALSNVAPGDVVVSFTSGTSLADASARLVLNWRGGAFHNTDPVITASFAGMTGGVNPTFTETIHQVIAIPSGWGSAKTIKAYRCVVIGATSLLTATNTARISIGIGTSSAQRAVAVLAENGGIAANHDTGVRTDDTGGAIVILNTNGTSVEADAHHFSFGTNNGEWIIQWNTKTSSNYRGSVWLFFGDDCEAYVDSFTSGATSGDTVTDNPGFTNAPRLVEVFSVDRAFSGSSAQVDAMLSWGAVDASLAQGAQAVVSENQQSNTSTGLVTDYAASGGRCVIRLQSAAGTVTRNGGLELTTLSASNITFTVRDANVAISAMYLAIGLPSSVGVKVGGMAFVAGTSGTGNPITGIGFVPGCYSIGSQRSATLGSVGTGQGQWAIGGHDPFGVTSSAYCWGDRDNRSTPESVSHVATTQVINVQDFGSPTDWAAEHSARSDDTITLNVVDTSASVGDRVVLYWTIEDRPTGTGAGTFPLATGTGTAIQRHTGTGAGMFPLATGTGTGTNTDPAFTGSGAGVFPLATGTGAGTLRFTGTGAGTFPLATGTGAGILRFTSTGAGVFPLATGTGTGILRFTGTGAGVFPLAVAAGSGTVVQNVTGTGAGVFPLATGAGSGTLLFSATGAGTFPLAQGTGTGTLRFSGSGAGVFPLAVAAGTGSLVFTGAGAAVLPLAQGSGAGLLIFTGTGAGVFPLTQGTGTGTTGISGTGAGTFPLALGAGTGTVQETFTGSGAGTFPLATGTGTAFLRFTGSGAGVFPLATGTGTGANGISGSGAGVFPLVQGTGTALLRHTGSGAGTFPLLTAAGAGTVLEQITGTGAGVFPLAQGTGTGILRFTGSGAGVFPLAQGTGTGRVGEQVACTTAVLGQYCNTTALEGRYGLSTSLQGRYDNTTDLEGQVIC